MRTRYLNGLVRHRVGLHGAVALTAAKLQSTNTATIARAFATEPIVTFELGESGLEIRTQDGSASRSPAAVDPSPSLRRSLAGDILAPSSAEIVVVKQQLAKLLRWGV